MLTNLHRKFVENIHLFRDLSADDMEDIWKHAHVINLDKEEVLFLQGNSAERFYLVFSGLVKLSRLSPDGQEKVMEIVKPGETFAEALMFLEHPYLPVSASALNVAEVISFDSIQFLNMLKQSPSTCLVMLGGMSQRIRGLVQEIDHLSVLTGRQRLSAYLLELAGESDSLHLPIQKAVLASRLSIKPETFSRIIKQFRTTNTIEVRGSDIEILDKDKLQEFALV